jgi:hypothetical protein
VPLSWANLAEENFKVWGQHWPVLDKEGLFEGSRKFVISDACAFTNGVNSALCFKEDKCYKALDSVNGCNELYFYARLETDFAVLKPFVLEGLEVVEKTEKGRF